MAPKGSPISSSRESPMRQVIDAQRQFGQVDMADIVFDPKSRDDIPQLLLGLQHLYLDPAVRERVFAILAEVLPERVDGEGPARADTGRPGMPQWTILVLGTLRLGLNADDDWSDATRYERQTLKDNLRRFTPDLLDRINQEVVRAGHAVLKKSRTQASPSAVTVSS